MEGAVERVQERLREADAWAEKGAGGLTDDREDEASVVWPDVTGICGFWDRSFRDTVCGVDMWISMFIPTLGWCAVLKKCEPVPGVHSLHAEMSVCSMFIGSLLKWIDACV